MAEFRQMLQYDYLSEENRKSYLKGIKVMEDNVALRLSVTKAEKEYCTRVHFCSGLAASVHGDGVAFEHRA